MLESAARRADYLLPRGTYRRWILASVLLGALLRVAICLFLYHKGYVYPDEDAYWHIAHRIREGYGISMAYDAQAGIIRANEPTAFWGFLFNVLVAGLQLICADSLLASRLLLGQLAWLLTVLAVLGFVRGALTPFQTFLAVLALALYPNIHFVAAFLMTEVVLTPLLLFSLWAGRQALSGRAAFLSGVAFGLMHLTKATLLGFQPLYMLGLAKRYGFRNMGRNLAIMAVGTIVIFGPWVARNTIQYKRLTFETKSGCNLWLFNNPHHTKPFWKEDFLGGVDMPSFGPELNEPARNDLCRGLFYEFVAARPGKYMELCASRFLNTWSLAPIYMKLPTWMRMGIGVMNLFLYVLMAAGAWISVKRRILPECVGVVVYMTVFLTLTVAAFRQRSYIDPCIIILAVLPLSALLRAALGPWATRTGMRRA